ncbi:MAG TPA: hypothetical protein VLV87_06705 [Gammaproteobacteria bacterium]|nr:hypothetical protein [Gammaproteobacteria bacterium]
MRSVHASLGLMLLLLAAALYAPGAAALDPNLDWRTLQSDHFVLVYHDGEHDLAQHMLDVAEQTYGRLNPWLGWVPEEKVQLVLTDHEDLPNGLTTSFPRDHVELYVVPPDNVDTLEDFDDWFRLLLTHEYTHVLQLDKATGAPAFLRHHVFGRNLLFFPGQFNPGMLLEGLAVYDETDAAAGIGRGQSSLYSMYMRAEVQRGVRPWSQVTMAGVTQWPGGTLPYLYGVNFYQFAAQQYGKASIPALVDDYSDNLVPFKVGWNMEEAFDGDDVPDVWPKFTDYLDKRFGAPPYPAGTSLVEGERLTRHGYDTSSPRAAADGRVFYVRDDWHEHPAVMVWKPGRGSHELAETFTPARLDWNDKAGLLMARPEICREYHYNFDLYRVDPDSGDVTRLTHCGRYHYGSWSPDGSRIAASHIELGKSSLVLLDGQGANPETVWTGDGGEILGGIDWSPDGDHIAAALWRPGRRWALEEFSLSTRQWTVLAQDVGDTADPAYTPDGKAVLFTSDADGVYNLRRVDRESGALASLTRVSTGAFSPTPGKDGDIFYIGYTGDGYDLYRLPAGSAADAALTPSHRSYTTLPPPPHADTQEGDYSPWASLLPAYWTPEGGFGPHVAEVGAATSGQDQLGVHVYAADLNYEVIHHSLGGSFIYTYADRLQFLAARLYSYDTISSKDATMARIRREDKLQGLWQRPWPSLERTLTFSIGAAGESDRDNYDLFTPEPAAKDSAAGIAFRWNSTHDWPVSISPNDGRDVTLVAESSNVFPSDFRGNAYRVDWNEYIPAGDETVVALRWLEGYGTEGIQPFNLGSATDPGYGTPAAELLFDRRQFAFPGYPSGLTELTGRRMRLASAGLRVPLWRPEAGWRIPPIGAHDFSLRMYYDMGGAWNQGGRPAHYSRSAGIELVSDLSVFYLLNIRLIVGTAHGFDTGGENQFYGVLEVPM